MVKPKQVKDAFEEGKIAESQNLPSKCPSCYDHKPELRKAWFDGYYQSYVLRRHKNLFDKYGIKYP